MKYVYVTSARRNPSKNPRVSEEEQLAKFHALDAKEQFPTYFISFTENLDMGKAQSRSHPKGQSKIGINPKFKYNNPIGVYCYPLRYSFDGKEELVVPFAGDRPFIQVVQLTANDWQKQVLSDLTYNKSRLERDIAKLESLYQSTDKELIENNTDAYYKALGRYSANSDNTDRTTDKPTFDDVNKQALASAKKFCLRAPLPIRHVWCLTHLLSYLLGNKGTKSTVTWNKILRQLGYVAVVDSGTGFIHSNEPTQALFLTNKAYKHVGMIEHFNEEDSVRDLDFANRFQLQGVLKNKLKSWSKDKVVINDSIEMYEAKIYNLPKTLVVNGSFIAEYSEIGNLPSDALIVKGDLILANSHLELSMFPSELEAESVDLSDTNIEYLPDGLTINGDLNLSNTKLLCLPDGLTVKGHLNIKNLGLAYLPDDLYVEGDLNLYYTNVSEIPIGAFVGGRILSDRRVVRLEDVEEYYDEDETYEEEENEEDEY